MPDVQFFGPGNRGDRLDISVSQSVAEMEMHAALQSEPAGTSQMIQFLSLFDGICRIGIPASVQFDRRTTERLRCFNLIFGRINEQADDDSGSVQLIDTATYAFKVADYVQPSFCRDLLPFFGN